MGEEGTRQIVSEGRQKRRVKKKIDMEDEGQGMAREGREGQAGAAVTRPSVTWKGPSGAIQTPPWPTGTPLATPRHEPDPYNSQHSPPSITLQPTPSPTTHTHTPEPRNTPQTHFNYLNHL